MYLRSIGRGAASSSMDEEKLSASFNPVASSITGPTWTSMNKGTFLINATLNLAGTHEVCEFE